MKIQSQQYSVHRHGASLLLAGIAIAFLATPGFCADPKPKTAPPNFVLMIADDMNWDDCGAYGHPAIRSPNLDRLASEGLRFEHAYLTTNSCSPSRASIITGSYPHNTGAEHSI